MPKLDAAARWARRSEAPPRPARQWPAACFGAGGPRWNRVARDQAQGEWRSRMTSTRTKQVCLPLAAALGLGLVAGSALAGGTLRVAMTASDVPTTTGAPDNGYEGVRF